MFAAHFAKEPRRQGIHERVAAEWLQQLPAVNQFKVLPKKGADAIYVTSDGEIQRGADLHNPPGKSLDFRWFTGETACYAMHKYTKQSGGDQDNQFTEMRNLLESFIRCRDRHCILLIIVDGPYYTKEKLETLKHLTRSHPPKSYATPIGKVPDLLSEYR